MCRNTLCRNATARRDRNSWIFLCCWWKKSVKWTIAPRTLLPSILNEMHSCTISCDISIKQSASWYYFLTKLLRATGPGYCISGVNQWSGRTASCYCVWDFSSTKRITHGPNVGNYWACIFTVHLRLPSCKCLCQSTCTHILTTERYL